MNDTQKRIAEYKQLLPGLKERIVAVALLLVVSLTMVTTTTFAWMVLSFSPEVSGVTTTVAANGNLEIALVKPDGSLPGESAIGDSFASEGQSLSNANLTWGNLINLNDPSYGLDNLVLRPAQLNPALLLTSPLYGAEYGEDGRIIQLNSNFAYTTWNPPEGDKPGYFGVSDDRGVRAISSTKIEAIGAAATYYKMLSDVKNKNLMAANTYRDLGGNDKYMPSLATMMGLYMTARMNPSHETLSNPDCNIEDIQNLRDMYAAFLGAFDMEADAIASLLNLQLFLAKGEGNYTPYTAESVYQTSTAELTNAGLQISSKDKATNENTLDQFIKDRNTIASDLEKLKVLCTSGTTLKWKDSGLNGIVNNLVNVGACTIGADNTPISSIGVSNAMGYLSGTQEARITNGILYRFEERTGGYIEVKDLGISATVSRSNITIPATVKANIQTTASRDYNLFTNDLSYTESLNTGNFQGGVPVAEDTFGLAVDFWVRTNAVGHYLVLQGNVLTRTDRIEATGMDPNGNEVQLYTLTRKVTDDEGTEIATELVLYQVETKAEDGTLVTTWYDSENHSVVTLEENEVPTKKIIEKEVVIGYEGDNRVWDESAGLSINSTTQGSGSCYVYYADTPEDQARSLKLLKSMRVAFVDDEGKLMASAFMDTERHYAANGKVIVPLVLDSMKSINVGMNIDGDTVYAISALEKNVAKMVTAIVYLDGTDLSNEDVLAAADIQGQLNIQFGAYERDLDNAEDEELKNQILAISGSLDKSQFNFDTDTDLTTKVTVTVEGSQPKTMTAFFLRAINSTQGSREEIIQFTKNADGVSWSGNYTFKAPGSYVLRSVRLDGVEYDLDTPLKVEVEGFTIDSLSWEFGGKDYTIMTADGSRSADVFLKFASNDVKKLPKTVQGRFLREDGTAVNVNFVYNSTTQLWTGTANFVTSGTYTLQYLVLDGEYTELDEALQKTARVFLGMRAAVYTTSPHKFKYVPSEMADNEKNLAMQIKILDNAGHEMPGLSGVKLIYSMKGSGIKRMDVDLTWNGSYYVGDMINGGPGIWQFQSVGVGGNTITYATTSPTFTILSPEPPEYHAHNTVAYQYSPNNNAVMNVQITNSAAASVQALIVKSDGTEYWVTGTIGGEFTEGSTPVNHWSFTVPKDANGYQDGNWTLKALKLWDVFAADGTEYTKEDPLEFDLSGTNNVTKVVNRIYVTFEEGQSKDFGKDANGNITSTFMTSHTISGLYVDIKDFAGDAVSNVTDVKLTFTYVTGSSSANGGYSSDALTNATEGATITVPLDSVNGTTYSQSTDATILYAGNYTTTFSFKVGGTEYKYAGTADDSSAGTKALPLNTPVMKVWSKAPTVTVTGISPTGSHRIFGGTLASDGSVNVAPLHTGDYNSYDDNRATVYIYAGDSYEYNVYYPTVTLTLSNMPNDFTSASFAVANNANSQYNVTYSFSPSDLVDVQTIGGGADGTASWLNWGTEIKPKIFPAGKQTIDEMTVVYNSMTFTVDLSNIITINQPQYPPYVDFKINDSTFTGTTPSRVYSEDGETITLTLPEITSWSHQASSSVNGDFAATGVTKTSSVYTSVKGTIRYTYTQYTQTMTEYQAKSSTTTWMVTKEITGWKIGNTTYKPGETVTVNVNGNQTITAVIKATDGEKTTESTTATKYYVTFAATGNTDKGLSSNHSSYGTKVSSVTAYWTDPTYS